MLKKRLILTAAALVVPLSCVRIEALPGDTVGDIYAVTDHDTYNVGGEVWLEIRFPNEDAVRTLDSLLLTMRYAGDTKPLLDNIILSTAVPVGPLSHASNSSGLHPFWKIPQDARTGRYEIALRVQNPRTHQVLKDIPLAGSFVVHRKLVQISSVELRQSYYASGDAIPCSVTFDNVSDQELVGLKLEFSERYWPWIVQQTEHVEGNIKTLQEDIILEPRQRFHQTFEDCAVAKAVTRTSIEQFAAVVWDGEQKEVYDIAISPLVFAHPPGRETTPPYPPQFMYPELSAVNTTAYHSFLPPDPSGGAIAFDLEHTMFPMGSDATARFSVRNPSEQPWSGVTIRASLRAPDGTQLLEKVLAENLDLAPHGPAQQKEVTFKLPAGAPAVYRVEVEVRLSSGQLLAKNSLEIAANPLPRSLMVFCAHEDDEGAHDALLRAAVENHLPVRVVYFTSGDAGSCDRYYQHSCGPEEALHFGAVRMAEARATLGHLGVPSEDVLFLGLPDGGSGKIWYEHRGSSDPYLSVLLASDHAPYEGLVRPNLPYARQAVVESAEALIKAFQPQVIVTAHPGAEGHIDHIVNGYFVVKALQELSRQGGLPPDLELRVDRIYNPKDHPSTPYHYVERSFAISGAAAARAQEAGWYYQSQGGNRAQGNPRSFSQLPRAQTYRVVLDWKEHEGWNEKN